MLMHWKLTFFAKLGCFKILKKSVYLCDPENIHSLSDTKNGRFRALKSCLFSSTKTKCSNLFLIGRHQTERAQCAFSNLTCRNDDGHLIMMNWLQFFPFTWIKCLNLFDRPTLSPSRVSVIAIRSLNLESPNFWRPSRRSNGTRNFVNSSQMNSSKIWKLIRGKYTFF